MRYTMSLLRTLLLSWSYPEAPAACGTAISPPDHLNPQSFLRRNASSRARRLATLGAAVLQEGLARMARGMLLLLLEAVSDAWTHLRPQRAHASLLRCRAPGAERLLAARAAMLRAMTAGSPQQAQIPSAMTLVHLQMQQHWDWRTPLRQRAAARC